MALQQLRSKIDALDAKIVDLINERAKISLSIGKEKIKNGQPIYAPARELQVLKRIKDLNKGPMTPKAFEAIYREVMSASLALEKPLNIAYMGPEATFSHLAALKRFGSSVNYVSCGNVGEVFEQVAKGEADYGVVPIENSIEGVVTHTMDILVETDLRICAQVMLDVSHNLMAKCPLNQVKIIYSHSQILGQCRQWLLKNMPKAELIATVSSTHAAQIAGKNKHAACIASEIAASLYGLSILKRNIQDSAHNITRFLVISNNDVPRTGHDRTSMVFAVNDKAGALHDMLAPFKRYKINLTKIESRPSKKKAWEYYFFVDCQGHAHDPHVARAISQLEEKSKFFKILGSYPVAE